MLQRGLYSVIKKQAMESRERKLRGKYILTCVSGDGKILDDGMGWWKGFRQDTIMDEKEETDVSR